MPDSFCVTSKNVVNCVVEESCRHHLLALSIILCDNDEENK